MQETIKKTVILESYVQTSYDSYSHIFRTVEIEIPDDGNECPTAKELVFNRLKKFGGVKWYRYLDMSNQVIRWVNENLEGME